MSEDQVITISLILAWDLCVESELDVQLALSICKVLVSPGGVGEDSLLSVA